MFPLSKETLDSCMKSMMIPNLSCATIRQISVLADHLEEHANEPMVHLEIGNPGLPAEEIGINAHCEALHSGVARMYPNVAGIPSLKKNASEFIKAFLDIDVPAETIVPTVGSMQGCFTLELLLNQRLKERDTILFINPGFPAQRHQAKVLGIRQQSFDIYNYRGEALRDKLEEELSTGRVTAMIYSNPNNPAWFNLTAEELRIIGEVATRHDVIVLEDLAYMGMDFRTDFSHPFEAPYIPSVAKYTDNYILMLSGSKIFSYAGERIAVVCMSDKVYHRCYETLDKFYDMPAFGDAYVFGVLYVASSGVSHSAQHALAAMFKAATEGKLPFVEHCREYGRRAELARKIFTDNGFHLVYAYDGDREISNGFFFTVGYPGLSSEELQCELLRYGAASISLPSTGSEQDGVRVTVSNLSRPEQFQQLRERLSAFRADHPVKSSTPAASATV
ncbi:MAG: pyridoxal phosphate-dependent aminotransferase [Muribaculaceae bacterium]|nr:pyridoxal phosphate-dependent aminotransferase [Muribaculaceae bacterium]